MKRFCLKATVAAMCIGVAAAASAESSYVTGAATASPGAQARVDFTITIPKILYLRVGDGSNYWASGSTLSTTGTVSLITFQPTAAVLGNGSSVAATVGSGDLGTGGVTAAVVSNSGNVTLTSTATGALNNGAAGDTINFSEITTTPSTINSATALPAPTLTNGTSTSVVLTAPATKVIKQDAKWTYAYANTTIPPAGSYGGVNVNNGRVTYTATMP